MRTLTGTLRCRVTGERVAHRSCHYVRDHGHESRQNTPGLFHPHSVSARESHVLVACVSIALGAFAYPGKLNEEV